MSESVSRNGEKASTAAPGLEPGDGKLEDNISTNQVANRGTNSTDHSLNIPYSNPLCQEENSPETGKVSGKKQTRTYLEGLESDLEQLQSEIERERVYGLILAGWYTGGRLGDLSRLRWSSVDLDEAQCVTFAQGKTGGIVRVPLAKDLEKWLRAQPRAQSAVAGGFVFPTLCNKPLAGDSGLSATFTKLVRKAGINGGLIRQGKGRCGRSVSSLSFHSLRHSFNSALANQGVSQELRKLLTGHKSTTMNDLYSHVTMTSLRTAIDTLPKLS